MTDLQPDDDRVQVQHWLPVLAQDVQTHIALKVDVWVVDLLGTLDLRWVVWEVLVDGECEVEAPALVHALVWLNSEVEVKNVVWIWELGAACLALLKLRKVLLNAQLGGGDFFLLWSVGVCSGLLLRFLGCKLVQL